MMHRYLVLVPLLLPVLRAAEASLAPGLAPSLGGPALTVPVNKPGENVLVAPLPRRE